MMDWIWSHPWIFATVLILVVIFLFVSTRNDQIVTANGGQEADQPDEVVYKKVSIFAHDGKLIEAVLIDEDTLSYDNRSFTGTTKEGKDVEFLTTGFLVKLEDL